jgi:hypothetical protein
MRFSNWEKIDQMRGSASRGVYLSACLHRSINARQRAEYCLGKAGSPRQSRNKVPLFAIISYCVSSSGSRLLLFTVVQSNEKRDLFVVIWSKNARDSKWVKKESRYALRRYKQHGSPDFRPIPIEGPPIASVPRGLRAYHFNDELLSLIRVVELEMGERKKGKSEEHMPDK